MPLSKIVKNSLEAGAAGTSWQSTKTASFTAVAGEGYSVDTSSGAITMTLPSSPSVGDTVEVIDVGGSLSTNNITVARNGSNINGVGGNSVFIKNNSHYFCIYLSTSEGWSISEAVDSNPIPVSYLVIAGGGGTYSDGANDVASGGAGAGGYINSYASESSGDNSSTASGLNLESGVTYTITVGSGGGSNSAGNDSKILQDTTTLVQAYGGGRATTSGSANGGSGGGSTFIGETGSATTAGTGVANQGGDGGTAFQNNASTYAAGGGGGASGNGGNASNSAVGDGANGLSSSITGSAVTRGGGGGGAARNWGGFGSGGTGGGGDGVDGTLSAGGNGTANTGGGAGGSFGKVTGASGGSGIVILRLPTALYSGTTTGSPTVTTDGSDTILQFTGSGSYTA